MKRNCVRLALVALCSLALPRTAGAGILSWLDQLSGPGPFIVFDASRGVWCSKKPSPSVNRETTMAAGRWGCQSTVSLEERNLTWYLTGGAGFALDNPLDYGTGNDKPPVRIVKLGTSLDYTIHPLLDIGAGVGVLYFNGPRFPNFARLYVEPLRLGFRPFLLGSGDRLTPRQNRLGAFVVYANWNIVTGTLEGRTFGAPSDPFRARNELDRKEFGLAIDFGRLFRR
ncbi:MAG: hypothetical protein M3545_10460 [Acidobacteriota bacterium]|nr:hypothetical protein [Acidobacteriota bacterium]